MNTNVVGSIRLGNYHISVYSSMVEPLFRVKDLLDLVEYGEENTWKLLSMCEEDEKVKLPMMVGGQTHKVNFVTELGLYNILAQSKKPLARIWRRVVHNQLIELRRSRGMNIKEQFDEWSDQMNSVYYDEETGLLMESVTVAGGDVEQRPVKEVG